MLREELSRFGDNRVRGTQGYKRRYDRVRKWQEGFRRSKISIGFGHCVELLLRAKRPTRALVAMGLPRNSNKPLIFLGTSQREVLCGSLREDARPLLVFACAVRPFSEAPFSSVPGTPCANPHRAGLLRTHPCRQGCVCRVRTRLVKFYQLRSAMSPPRQQGLSDWPGSSSDEPARGS